MGTVTGYAAIYRVITEKRPGGLHNSNLEQWRSIQIPGRDHRAVFDLGTISETRKARNKPKERAWGFVLLCHLL